MSYICCMRFDGHAPRQWTQEEIWATAVDTRKGRSHRDIQSLRHVNMLLYEVRLIMDHGIDSTKYMGSFVGHIKEGSARRDLQSPCRRGHYMDLDIHRLSRHRHG